MQLELLRKTDKELFTIADGSDLSLAKQAKKEIKRRKAVGFWDGTAAFVVNEDNETVEEERSTEYVYAKGVRRF
tara:strand:+ start:106 stop:327 length:222 start_codon:yes stop_codon:yes gene_type:complete